jgi:hypothetical protein
MVSWLPQLWFRLSLLATPGLQVTCASDEMSQASAALISVRHAGEKISRSLRAALDSNLQQQLSCKASTCPCSAVQLLLGQLADIWLPNTPLLAASGYETGISIATSQLVVQER